MVKIANTANNVKKVRKQGTEALLHHFKEYHQVLKIRALITKLLILLISNVIISLLCLLVLFRDVSYTAACVDMMVSNICLWLSYNFNHDIHMSNFSSRVLLII